MIVERARPSTEQQHEDDRRKGGGVNDFKILALKELTDQQVRFAPPARRLEQLSKAEKLLAEVDTARQYPYQFVCFRITDYRPTARALAGTTTSWPGGVATTFRRRHCADGHGQSPRQ